jgi:hypothetical protein
MHLAARLAWDALAPLLPDAGLRALLAAAERDDPALVQGVTTDCGDADPEADVCWLDRPVTGACVLGYCAWQGEGLTTCAEVEEAFTKLVERAANRLDDRYGLMVRALLDWLDDSPRLWMRLAVQSLARRELARRAAVAKGRVADGDVAAGVP